MDRSLHETQADGRIDQPPCREGKLSAGEKGPGWEGEQVATAWGFVCFSESQGKRGAAPTPPLSGGGRGAGTALPTSEHRQESRTTAVMVGQGALGRELEGLQRQQRPDRGVFSGAHCSFLLEKSHKSTTQKHLGAAWPGNPKSLHLAPSNALW